MIHLLQCMCPSRHCIVAIAYDPDSLPAETAMNGFQSLVGVLIQQKRIDPFCGLCGSRVWHYEDGVSKFKTVQEAMPMLQALELQQARFRQFITRN
jgi:hypothetical protein